GETYELDKAPADMKISADGTLTWQVPPRYSASADVQLYSTNADQKRLIKFKLNAGKRTKDGVVAVERLPKMSDDQEYLPLDGKIARVAVVQDGRYAVCGIPDKNRLAVIDLVEIKEIASIDWPVTDKPGGFAAGGERVVVYDRQREVL